jgi:hypothetical protein
MADETGHNDLPPPSDTPQVPAKKKNKGGRPPNVVLTPELARQLSVIWRLSGPCGAITDEQAAEIVGVTYGTLNGWLHRNTIPTDSQTNAPVVGGSGLRDTRARARANFTLYYLGKVEKSIQIAELNEDPHGMRIGATWMMEKLNPKMFPREEPPAQEAEEQTPDKIRQALREIEELHQPMEGGHG